MSLIPEAGAERLTTTAKDNDRQELNT